MSIEFHVSPSTMAAEQLNERSIANNTGSSKWRQLTPCFLSIDQIDKGSVSQEILQQMVAKKDSVLQLMGGGARMRRRNGLRREDDCDDGIALERKRVAEILQEGIRAQGLLIPNFSCLIFSTFMREVTFEGTQMRVTVTKDFSKQIN
jgi:hypothetical protein